MQLETLIAVVTKFNHELPRPIKRDLIDVELMVAPTVEAARKTLADLLGTDDTDEDGEETGTTTGPAPNIPDDTKGMFLGEPMESEEDKDEEGEDTETVSLPEGFIILVAANLADEKEAAIVLLHEVGHALGLDEAGVAQLGLGGVPSVEISADGDKLVDARPPEMREPKLPYEAPTLTRLSDIEPVKS